MSGTFQRPADAVEGSAATDAFAGAESGRRTPSNAIYDQWVEQEGERSERCSIKTRWHSEISHDLEMLPTGGDRISYHPLRLDSIAVVLLDSLFRKSMKWRYYCSIIIATVIVELEAICFCQGITD